MSGNLQRAVGYTRVSTLGQAVEGVSLEAQSDRIQKWCVANDHTLVSVEVDAGLSGSTSNRPGLQHAIDLACRNNSALVVYSLSRIGRSTTNVLEIATRLERSGANLVSLTERIDTTSAAGKMVFRLLAVLSEFERDLVVERTKAAMAHMRRQDRRISGNIPFGYDLDDADKVTLLPSPSEQCTVLTMKALREQGHSYDFIAQSLNQQQIASKSGGRWSAKTVRGVLLRSALKN